MWNKQSLREVLVTPHAKQLASSSNKSEFSIMLSVYVWLGTNFGQLDQD